MLIDQLKLKDDLAVRLGTWHRHGGKLGNGFLKKVRDKKTRDAISISAQDRQPHLTQKGVDMKIGLDVSLLAAKKIVRKVILITGDSDFVPVMKLARREGLKVYLNTFGHSVSPTLKEHADGLIELSSNGV